MKKKLLSALALFLCLLMTFALVSCDTEDKNDAAESVEDEDDEKDISGETSTPTGEGNGSLKDAWNAALQLSAFDNVTVTHLVTFREGYSTVDEPLESEMKLAGDKMAIDGRVDTDAEEVSSSRTAMLGSLLPMLEDLGRFTYNEETKAYEASAEYTYQVTVITYEATLTASNVQAFFDSDMHLTKLVFHMVQEGVADGEAFRYVLDAEFTFADYGTTVVE